MLALVLWSGDHAGDLGYGRPPTGQGEYEEDQVIGVKLPGDGSVGLSVGDSGCLVALVLASLFLVGVLRVYGEAFPALHPLDLGMVPVYCVDSSDIVVDV